MLSMIQALYAMNGLCAILLYVPQIFRAWKEDGEAKSMSLVTFGGWSLGSLITALYAWFSAGDLLFTAISLGNMMGSGSIFLLVGQRRWRNRRTQGLTAGKPVLPLSACHKANGAAGLAEHHL